MDLKKKTSIGSSNKLISLAIKFAFLFIVLFLIIFLFDKINFPHPIKKIEKIISNETFKVVK